MFEPTNVTVVTAEDGQKALVVELAFIVPLQDDFAVDIATKLLGIEADEPITEQDQEDTHEHD